MYADTDEFPVMGTGGTKMKAFYMKDSDGFIIDDCQAASKDDAKNIFLSRGHKLPFGIEE